MVAKAGHTGAVTEVEVYEEARGRWAEFLNGKDVWSPLAHAGVLVEGMRDIVARAVAEQDAFEAGLEWTSGFGAKWIEARIEDRLEDAHSGNDAVDIGRLVENTRLLGAAAALALGANRAAADPTGGAWERAVEVVRGLGIDVTDGVKASAFGSGALDLIEAAAPAASELSEVATVGSWATWLVTNGPEGRGLRVPVVSVGGATSVKAVALLGRETGGLMEHPRSALLPLGSKYVGAIWDAWESAGKPAVTWQLDGFKAGSGNQLGASHGGQVAVGMRLVTRGAEVYDSSHVVMATVEKTAEGGWILKPLDGEIEIAKVGALLGERPAGSISVLAKRECHAAIEKSARERGGAGEVRTHWTSDLDKAAKWAVGDLEELLDYLEEQIRMATQLPKYYPAGVSFEGIRQRVRVSTKRLRRNEEEARAVETRRRQGDFLDEEGEGGRAYLRRGAEQYEEQREDVERVEVLEWSEAWKKEQRVVVLGDPGFGKTWLLKSECCRLARAAIEELTSGEKGSEEVRVPIFARLSNVNRTDGGFGDELIEWASKGRGEALRKRLEDGLKTGGCVVLLDAWDEVPVERVKPGALPRFKMGRRERLGQRLDEFGRAYSRARVVMTSRIVGYGTSPIAGAKEMELVAFDREEVRAFTRGWFGSRSSAGAELARMVQTNHQVGQLGRIPLMLSMMCRVYGEKWKATAKDRRKELPVRRVELYERCLRGLLRDWKEEDKKATVNDATLEAMLEMLETLALELLEDRREQFTAATLRKAIQTYQGGSECPTEFRTMKPGKLIDRLESDGILVRAGEERDASLLFLHRTFQEYLAAGSLARRAREKGWDAIAETIDERTLEAEWDEVVILLAGTLERPESLLTRLSDPSQDTVLRHRLGLAAQCLAEVDWLSVQLLPLVRRITVDTRHAWTEHAMSATTSAVPHLSSGLICLARLNPDLSGCNLLFEVERDLLSGNAASLARALQVAETACSDTVGNNMIPAVAAALRHDDMVIRTWAAKALGRFGTAVSATPAMSQLLQVIADDESAGVCIAAAKALENMGSAASASESFVALIGLMLDTKRKFDGHRYRSAVSEAAAQAIGKIWGHSPSREVLTTLATLLRDSESHTSATEIVRHMGAKAATTDILNALAVMAPEQSDIFNYVAHAVKGIGGAAATPAFVAALIALLRDQNWKAQYSATSILKCLTTVTAEPELLSGLAELWSHNNERLRRSARSILSELSQRGDSAAGEVVRVLEAAGHLRYAASIQREITARTDLPAFTKLLLARLSDEDSGERVEAVRGVSECESVSPPPEVLAALAALATDEARSVRAAVAEQIGYLDSSALTPELLGALANLLKASSDAYALTAVVRLGRAALHPDIIAALLQQLENDDPLYRCLAACAIESLGAVASAPAVTAALETLPDRERTLAREIASVGNITSVDPVGVLTVLYGEWGGDYMRAWSIQFSGRLEVTEIRELLIELLLHSESSVRRAAAMAAGTRLRTEQAPDVLAALSGLLRDEDAEIRREAAISIRRSGTALKDPEILPLLVATLSDEDARVRATAADAIRRVGTAARRLRRSPDAGEGES